MGSEFRLARLVQILAFASCWAGETHAASASLHVALEYSSAPELSDCPSSAELSAAISGQLGYDPFAARTGVETQRMRASIARTSTGTMAQLAWLNAQGESEGERHLASESHGCAEIARALTFAIAVQIQLHAATEPAPPPPPLPAPPPPLVTKHVPRPHVERPIRAIVGAGVLAERGFTPTTSPGLRVLGALWTRPFSFEASASVTLPSQLMLADGSGFSAVSLLGSVTPCARYSAFGFCAVGAMGLLTVRGEGVDRSLRPSSLLAAAGARVEVLWPALSALGVLVHVDVLLPITSRTVWLNQEPVWSTAPVILSAGCDLGAILR